MSTTSLQPAWKQEVNQRIAAHKNRKGTVGGTGQMEPPKPGPSRAAEAAARVAARYAKAPSYTQMQAEETRLARRAGEIATQVANEAPAASESAPAEMHATFACQTMCGPDVAENIERSSIVEELPSQSPMDRIGDSPAIDESQRLSEIKPMAATLTEVPEPHSVVAEEVAGGMSFNLRWEPDLPARAARTPPTAVRDQEAFERLVEDRWTSAQVSATLHSEPIEVNASSSQANLIEFPRELVAPRKMRPRLAEALAGVPPEPEVQLSIFEVDPGSVSTEPTAGRLATEPMPASWSRAGWSGMELEAQPVREDSPRIEAAERHRPQLASLGLRLMALVVDGSLILASFFAGAIWTASRISHVPAPKMAEALAVLGLAAVGFAYHALFFVLARSTPGMRYAGIALSTLEGEVPTRGQLRRRLGAMVLSILPVGLGIVWSIFDEDHLSWHDRISRTYLRKR